jgi:nucleoside 2-deoxyribosyltransferase
MMRVYLCSRWGRRDELRAYKRQLEASGLCTVTSRWLLDGTHDADGRTDMARRFADEDLQDIAGSDLLIAFTEAPESPYGRGGRHVELGYAIGIRRPVWIVGPRENVFAYLSQVQQFQSLAGVIERLQQRTEAVTHG